MSGESRKSTLARRSNNNTAFDSSRLVADVSSSTDEEKASIIASNEQLKHSKLARSQRLQVLLKQLNAAPEDSPTVTDTISASSVARKEQLQIDRLAALCKRRAQERARRLETAAHRQFMRDQAAKEERIQRESESERKRQLERQSESEKKQVEMLAAEKLALEKKQERDIYQQKMLLATLHHVMILLIRDSWLPWCRLVEMQRQQRASATEFARTHLQRITLNHMKVTSQRLQCRRQQKVVHDQECADRLAQCHLSRRILRAWHHLVRIRLAYEDEKIFVIAQQRMRPVFQRWLLQARALVLIEDQRLADIEYHAVKLLQIKVQRRMLTTWRVFASLQRDEKRKAQVREATMLKVNGWLSEFKSSSTSRRLQ